MDTKLGRLSEVPVSTGAYANLDAPIRRERFTGFHEARLAKPLGLTQFGVNHVTLDPGAQSSLRHWHTAEDEFVYVLSGEVVLMDENGDHLLAEGGFAAFPAGQPNAHHLENRSLAPARLLVVGARQPGRETVHYPDDGIGPFLK